jgi:hypothetical protein
VEALPLIAPIADTPKVETSNTETQAE